MIKRQQKTRHEIIQKFHSLRFLLARFLISNVTRRLPHFFPQYRTGVWWCSVISWLVLWTSLFWSLNQTMMLEMLLIFTFINIECRLHFATLLQCCWKYLSTKRPDLKTPSTIDRNIHKFLLRLNYVFVASELRIHKREISTESKCTSDTLWMLESRSDL